MAIVSIDTSCKRTMNLIIIEDHGSLSVVIDKHLSRETQDLARRDASVAVVPSNLTRERAAQFVDILMSHDMAALKILLHVSEMTMRPTHK